jgi:hypothetical protein
VTRRAGFVTLSADGVNGLSGDKHSHDGGFPSADGKLEGYPEQVRVVVLVGFGKVPQNCLDPSALSGVADFTKACGDQAQERGNVWKNSDDSGPSFDLPVDALDHFAGTHFHPMLWGQVETVKLSGTLASIHTASSGMLLE